MAMRMSVIVPIFAELDPGRATTANRYAEILGLRFAYARNGAETIELDYFTGKEAKSSSYPKPENLWQRFRKGKSLIDDTQVQQLLTRSTSR